MKSCDEAVTIFFPHNGIMQQIIMNASESNATETPNQRIAYSIPEAAEMLGLDYFSVYRLVQRGKLKACRVLRGKFLIPRTELFRLLNAE
ncbi:MAG: helix-turn-helix domain-containing protein [Verrucomicrobiota bacterium]|jgi:excisionase family DNA binding protein